MLTVTPTSDLKYNQKYYLKIDTLENNQGVNTLAQSSTFTTELSTVNVTKPQTNALVIYPNPASDRIYINSDNISTISRVELMNAIGNIVRILDTPSATGNELSLNVSDLPSGVYFVRVLCDGKIQTQRILVSR
jgi:hypothetical protein